MVDAEAEAVHSFIPSPEVSPINRYGSTVAKVLTVHRSEKVVWMCFLHWNVENSVEITVNRKKLRYSWSVAIYRRDLWRSAGGDCNWRGAVKSKQLMAEEQSEGGREKADGADSKSSEGEIVSCRCRNFTNFFKQHPLAEHEICKYHMYDYDFFQYNHTFVSIFGPICIA